MSGWILLFLIVTAVVLYLFILVRNFQAKERASIERIDAHLSLLNSGIDTVTQEKGGDAEKSSPITLKIKNLWGYPPNKDIVIQEIILDEQVPKGWDIAIHIHEDAEQYLGSELFINLANRVAFIPGIEGCQHDDREIFLISSTGYTPDILAELFWSEFLHAAEIARIIKQ